MKTAVISFTENGRKLSARIAAEMPGAVRYCFHRYSDADAVSFTEISALIPAVFDRCGALIFISSVGIAVRAVAGHIVSKVTDPAVVAVDDGGRFAVSVLSGHLGGANELARKTAGITGAVPVITTATDSHGLFSPDMFAEKNGLVICDMDAAKAVAAAVVNGEEAGFSSCFPCSGLPAGLNKNRNCRTGICISEHEGEKPFETTLFLLPKNLVAGIGCKKAAPADVISKHVMSVFSENGLDMRRLACAATIDIKAGEAGLLGFCERFGVELKTFTADELMSAHGEFSHSDFVEKTTGADNVCERAAVCAGGKLIVRRTAGSGVTAAVAELPVNISFERNET